MDLKHACDCKRQSNKLRVSEVRTTVKTMASKEWETQEMQQVVRAYHICGCIALEVQCQ